VTLGFRRSHAWRPRALGSGRPLGARQTGCARRRPPAALLAGACARPGGPRADPRLTRRRHQPQLFGHAPSAPALHPRDQLRPVGLHLLTPILRSLACSGRRPSSRYSRWNPRGHGRTITIDGWSGPQFSRLRQVYRDREPAARRGSLREAPRHRSATASLPNRVDSIDAADTKHLHARLGAAPPRCLPWRRDRAALARAIGPLAGPATWSASIRAIPNTWRPPLSHTNESGPEGPARAFCRHGRVAWRVRLLNRVAAGPWAQAVRSALAVVAGGWVSITT
jgi:hypothetical protein